METWPDKFPIPQLAGYQVKPQDPVQRTQMMSGTQTRRMHTTTPAIIPVKLTMDATQLSFFQTWHNVKINGGADWFLMPVMIDGVLENRECIFDKMYAFKPLHKDLWHINFSLRLRDYQTNFKTETELDAYLAN